MMSWGCYCHRHLMNIIQNIYIIFSPTFSYVYLFKLKILNYNAEKSMSKIKGDQWSISPFFLGGNLLLLCIYTCMNKSQISTLRYGVIEDIKSLKKKGGKEYLTGMLPDPFAKNFVASNTRISSTQNILLLFLKESINKKKEEKGTNHSSSPPFSIGSTTVCYLACTIGRFRRSPCVTSDTLYIVCVCVGEGQAETLFPLTHTHKNQNQRNLDIGHVFSE